MLCAEPTRSPPFLSAAPPCSGTGCRAGQLTSRVPAAILCAELDACLLGLKVAQQPVASHLHDAGASEAAVLAERGIQAVVVVHAQVRHASPARVSNLKAVVVQGVRTKQDCREAGAEQGLTLLEQWWSTSAVEVFRKRGASNVQSGLWQADA